MCVNSLTRNTCEAIVRFPDGVAFLAYQKACGCTDFRPATEADFERSLPVIEGQPDTETADEPVVPALTLAA
jgi:hypothetical protein